MLTHKIVGIRVGLADETGGLDEPKLGVLGYQADAENEKEGDCRRPRSGRRIWVATRFRDCVHHPQVALGHESPSSRSRLLKSPGRGSSVAPASSHGVGRLHARRKSPMMRMPHSTSARHGGWMGMPAPAGKSLIVSLHDAHPGSRAAIAEQVALSRRLRRHAQQHPRRAGVPSRGLRRGETRAFCDAVSAWQAAGHEIVLHGYFHDRRESPRETLGTLFWTRLYTNREAEFLDLPRGDGAHAPAARARAFRRAGLERATGFIAPAWLMAPQPARPLAETGLRLHQHACATSSRCARRASAAPIVSQSLCYSTRAALAAARLGALEQATFRTACARQT